MPGWVCDVIFLLYFLDVGSDSTGSSGATTLAIGDFKQRLIRRLVIQKYIEMCFDLSCHFTIY